MITVMIEVENSIMEITIKEHNLTRASTTGEITDSVKAVAERAVARAVAAVTAKSVK